jgi:hypothetical protein
VSTDAHHGGRRANVPARGTPLVLVVAMAMLLAGISAGLARMGVEFPLVAPALAAVHGPLMVAGFLGTLIGLERAAALRLGWAYIAPAFSALGAISTIVFRETSIGPALIAIGSAAMVAIFAEIIRRQPELFNVVMGVGAVSWLVGNLIWLAGATIPEVIFWWAAFLVLTIMGERLELSRLTSSSARGRIIFTAAASLYAAGTVLAAFLIEPGFRVIGAGMIALVFWFMLCDTARRTIRARGLPRFIAVNLIAGAAWLGASGIFWIAYAANVTMPHYDAMLHSVFLGFVFSMIFAHAPVIFPGVTGRPVPFRRAFYAHVVVLHFSLLLRVFGGDLGGIWWAYQWGGILNAAAIVIFIANTAVAITFAGSSVHSLAQGTASDA